MGGYYRLKKFCLKRRIGTLPAEDCTVLTNSNEQSRIGYL